MSTVFRTLFDASTVKEGEMRAVCESGVWQSAMSSVSCAHVRVSLRSIAFLQTKEFSGWNIIEDF